MKLLRMSLGISLTLVIGLAFAQIERGPVPIDPEIIAKTNRAQAATVRGEEFLKNKQFDKAIEAFREAVRIEDTLGYFTSGGNYDLAVALTTAGRPKEALAAYKKAFRWDPGLKELTTNGPPAIGITMDYAMLLAKSGKDDEAKAIYYCGMRRFGPTSDSSHEPFPFLVVFEPDENPDVTVWEYSPERLISVANMAKAASKLDPEAYVALARLREPTWIIPVVYQASIKMKGPKKTELINLAMALATTDSERAWIKAFEAGEDLSQIGVEMRKSSSVLNKAKADLEKTHNKVAIEYKRASK